jgi:hypothetical protein
MPREAPLAARIRELAERLKKRRPEREPIAAEPVTHATPVLTYAHPWPDALPGTGRRTLAALDQCADCEQWSWARYGDLVLCLACARLRASRAR